MDHPLFSNLTAAVRRGNLRRDHHWLQQGLAFIPTYVANGSFGGLVDEFGLHTRANYTINNGRTHVAHVNHYSQRPDNGGHLLRSLFHMQATGFRGEPPGLGLVARWEQELDLWTACCTTQWAERGSQFATRVWASWAMPHLWVWELDQELADPGETLTLSLEFDVRAAENHKRGKPTMEMHELELTIEPVRDGFWRATSRTDCRESRLLFRIEDGEVSVEGSRLQIRAGERCSIRLLYLDAKLDAEIATAPETYLERADLWDKHTGAVQQHWETSGMLVLPEGTPEASWWPLYAYYLPAVLPSQPSHILVADGLTANNWGHGFPQDQWYVMLPVARLGLKAINEAQLPYYNQLDAFRRYTKRICKSDGIFYPWAAPFENIDGFETNGPTNPDTYQFHNAAYVFAMVWESYRIHRDEAFLRTYFPLLEGVVEFFAANTEIPEAGSAIFKNDDVPLRCQDEATPDGFLTIQPICAVWACLYTMPKWLEAAQTLGMPDSALTERVRAILKRGYDLDTLIRSDGTLRTSATDPRGHGEQKHPIQLNPLTYLPMAEWMDWQPVHATWQVRHLLCKKTRIPVSLGWTLAQIVFSSARMRDGQAVEHDLDLVQRARYADPMWIQFYECSNRWGWTERIAFYFVTMQIYTATLLECIVQDCRGAIEFFPALLPRWSGEPIAFRKLHLRDGLLASGFIHGETFELELTASLDSEFPLVVSLPGEFILIQGGETRAIAGKKPDTLRMAAGTTVQIHSAQAAVRP